MNEYRLTFLILSMSAKVDLIFVTKKFCICCKTNVLMCSFSRSQESNDQIANNLYEISNHSKNIDREGV